MLSSNTHHMLQTIPEKSGAFVNQKSTIYSSVLMNRLPVMRSTNWARQF